jgi:hypothetical protein
MMRPMGVSVLPVDMVVLPEWLLWFMCRELSLSSAHSNPLRERGLVGGYVTHEIVRLFFFKSYVTSYGYVRRPRTDRIPEGVKQKLRQNRNPDSCGKSATGMEKTGTRRIPAGICNLVQRGCRFRGISTWNGFLIWSNRGITHEIERFTDYVVIAVNKVRWSGQRSAEENFKDPK